MKKNDLYTLVFVILVYVIIFVNHLFDFLPENWNDFFYYGEFVLMGFLIKIIRTNMSKK